MLTSVSQIYTGKITVNRNPYYSVEVDTSTLLKGTTVLDSNGQNIKNKAGVYIFVVNRNVPNFNDSFFNKDVTGYFWRQRTLFSIVVGVPHFKEYPQKDCIFYVGSAGQITSRLKEHWNNAKINGCTSLKLGFDSRKWIKNFLRVFVIPESINENLKHKELEKDIRSQYGTAYGD
jgi:hypothetical protein